MDCYLKEALDKTDAHKCPDFTFDLTPNNNTTLPNGVTLIKVLKYPYDIQYILKCVKWSLMVYTLYTVSSVSKNCQLT